MKSETRIIIESIDDSPEDWSISTYRFSNSKLRVCLDRSWFYKDENGQVSIPWFKGWLVALAVKRWRTKRLLKKRFEQTMEDAGL